MTESNGSILTDIRLTVIFLNVLIFRQSKDALQYSVSFYGLLVTTTATI